MWPMVAAVNDRVHLARDSRGKQKPRGGADNPGGLTVSRKLPRESKNCQAYFITFEASRRQVLCYVPLSHNISFLLYYLVCSAKQHARDISSRVAISYQRA